MRVMFLQGHPSAFSRSLGQALASRGHAVSRINLCFGDWLFWHGKECTSFRGRMEDWEDWIGRRMQAEGTTHLIYFADRQPYHVRAQRAARRLGIRCISYEFGYLRPDWILVEEGGQSAFSHFPDRVEDLHRIAEGAAMPEMRCLYRHPLWQEAVREMAYHLGNVLFRPVYPHFQTDRVDHPVVEYLSYLPRNIAAGLARREAARIMRRLTAGGERFHLFALQMAGDYQIRANSVWAQPEALLRQVFHSFAAHGPQGGVLVVKLHPLDNGRVRWRRLVSRLAQDCGIAARVVFLDGGDLAALLDRAEGCVVVNSTVGMHALRAGCPVKCLGIATYDVAGVTHQGGLDGFWSRPERPDPSAVSALIRAMATALHVRGDFFDASGRQAAVAAFVALLEEDRARRLGAVRAFPPRLQKARDSGLPIAPWDGHDAEEGASDLIGGGKAERHLQPGGCGPEVE